MEDNDLGEKPEFLKDVEDVDEEGDSSREMSDEEYIRRKKRKIVTIIIILALSVCFFAFYQLL